jgi:mRNA interferase MazF
MVDYIPGRGDIVWLDFGPQKGKEISKTRPALVISPLKYNKKTSLALFMPITSQVKNYPFEIEINTNEIQGAILCDQVRSLDWQLRRARKITTLDKNKTQQALSMFKLLLD